MSDLASRLRSVVARMFREEWAAALKGYDPEEARDEGGKWTAGGGGANSSPNAPATAAVRSTVDVEEQWVSRDEAELAARNILGRADGTLDEIAPLVGAVGVAKVSVFDGSASDTHGRLTVSVEGDGYKAKRIIRAVFRDGKRVGVQVQNLNLKVSDTGKGLGTQIFAAQVESLSKVGGVIEATADRGEGVNGYYTWPRLGYESDPFDAEEKARLPKSLVKAKTVSDLMKSDTGRKWWKANGWPIGLKFDTSDGSKSRKILDAYIRGKVKTKSAPQATEDTDGVPILSPADEALLDRIWAAFDTAGAAYERTT